MLATGVSAVGIRNSLPSVAASTPFLHRVILVGKFGELAGPGHAVRR